MTGTDQYTWILSILKFLNYSGQNIWTNLHQTNVQSTIHIK